MEHWWEWMLRQLITNLYTLAQHHLFNLSLFSRPNSIRAVNLEPIPLWQCSVLCFDDGNAGCFFSQKNLEVLSYISLRLFHQIMLLLLWCCCGHYLNGMSWSCWNGAEMKPGNFEHVKSTDVHSFNHGPVLFHFLILTLAYTLCLLMLNMLEVRRK